MVNLHLALSVAILVSGLFGTFYVSAQALGFDNLFKITSRLSAFIDSIIDVQYITFSDAHTSTINAKINKYSTYNRVEQLPKAILQKMVDISWLITNVFIVHPILGILAALGWIILFPRLGLNIPSWSVIAIAIAIWAIVGNIFGEAPHRAVAKIARFLVIILKKHFEWVSTNTKDGGKTGIVGFFFLVIAIICQFAQEIIK